MQKNLFLSLLLLFFLASTTAQIANVQEAINRDVWYPFVEAYGSYDTDAFMNIHTADVLRIIRDGSEIVVGEEYRAAQARNDKRALQAGATRSISFRFLERFAREDVAFEVGYYKVVSRWPDQEEKTFYGQFQVILKRVDGRWKLWVDSDTSHGGTIGEADFLRGTVLE